METYIRFMTTLAFGLLGTSMVLKVLLETIFHDWDAFADLGEWAKEAVKSRAYEQGQRVEDFQLEIEKSRAPRLNTRLYDIKREQLRQVDVVEHQLSQPGRGLVLTPIPPAHLSATAD